ncbi:MAG: OmpH family outer membrane protein [Candidatus Coatesbacteria bacterium]|nr:OmpH family outer membrane protein [Candidatus Coatesbacteria bacterium]
MKSIFLFIIILIAFIHAEDVKIGWIDSDQVLQEFKGRDELKAAFEAKVRQLEVTAKKMQEELIILRNNYQKNLNTWSEKTKTEKQEELKTKIASYQEFVKNSFGKDGVAEKEMKRITDPVIKQIYQIITNLTIKYKYFMIFDKRGIPQILYAKPELDMTKEVVEELNKNYKSQVEPKEE